MTPASVARRRVRTQGLARPRSTDPADVVRWLGAVQAQELPLARWSLAQRTVGPSAASVDAALASGAILRTHVLRPTWHFVAREDLRWMVLLTAPHVLTRMRPWDRRAGLDEAAIAGGIRRIARVLAAGEHATRARLAQAFARTPVAGQPWLLGHLLMHAEQRGVVCSSVPRDGQQTYALVDDRAPGPALFAGDAALAELATRYFRSHGPATEADFAWWSGLPLRAARRGIDAAGAAIVCVTRAGTTWLSVPDAGSSPGQASRAEVAAAHLLQSFDELIVAYSDTRAVVDTSGLGRAADRQGLLARTVLADGQVVGRWRLLDGRGRSVEVLPFRPLSLPLRRRVADAVARFERFLAS